MSAHRHQSTWRSLVFNRVYVDTGLTPEDPANVDPTYQNSDYRLESLDMTSVQTLDYRELRQHLEGAQANASYEGVRLLVGRGLIYGSSYADLEDKTWAMYEAFSPAACRIAFAASDPVNLGAYSFKRDTAGGTKALRFYCKPAAGRPVLVGRMREGLNRRFLFQLVATDPFAYDETETQTTVALGGGNVTNPGNMYTRPKIRITMSGAGNAAFTINVAGRSVTYDLSSFANGNVIILDTAACTATYAGLDRLSKLTAGFLSDLYLSPGVNAVSFTNTTNVSSVRFDFRGAYA